MFVKIIIGLHDEVRNLPSINFKILKEMQNMTEKTKDIKAWSRGLRSKEQEFQKEKKLKQ